MLDLSPETEKLARRIAEVNQQSVDQTVRDALRARESMRSGQPPKSMSPEAIADRMAATDKIVGEMAALPVLDPRPIQEIVDDINEI